MINKSLFQDISYLSDSIPVTLLAMTPEMPRNITTYERYYVISIGDASLLRDSLTITCMKDA